MEQIIERFLKDRVENYRDICKDGIYIRLYINSYGDVGAARYLAHSDVYDKVLPRTMEASWLIDLINMDRPGVVQYYVADLGVSCRLNGMLHNTEEEIDFKNTGFFKYSVELWHFINQQKQNRRGLCELLHGRELTNAEFADVYDQWTLSINDDYLLVRLGSIAIKSDTLFMYEQNLSTDISILMNKRKTQMNHYEFIEKHGPKFSEMLGIDNVATMSGAHGDKCYQYRDAWEKQQIPFGIGCLVYLLTYVSPYSETVRSTDSGFVPPCDWVIYQIKNNPKIKEAIAAIGTESN